MASWDISTTLGFRRKPAGLLPERRPGGAWARRQRLEPVLDVDELREGQHACQNQNGSGEQVDGEAVERGMRHRQVTVEMGHDYLSSLTGRGRRHALLRPLNFVGDIARQERYRAQKFAFNE